MEKKDWKNSLELLENLLKKKKGEIKKQENDVVEIEYSIQCYRQKIKSLH